MAVAARYGFSLSSLVNAFLIEIGESESVPIRLSVKARRKEAVVGPYPKHGFALRQNGILDFETIR